MHWRLSRAQVWSDSWLVVVHVIGPRRSEVDLLQELAQALGFEPALSLIPRLEQRNLYDPDRCALHIAVLGEALAVCKEQTGAVVRMRIARMNWDVLPTHFLAPFTWKLLEEILAAK